MTNLEGIMVEERPAKQNDLISSGIQVDEEESTHVVEVVGT